MEIGIISGDRQIIKSDEFPQTLTPFPEPTDLAYPIPDRRPSSPPHKLRPIRSSGISPADRDRFEPGSFVEGWEASGAESDSRLFSDLSLSSDDPNDHSSAKSEEPTNRKRKRKSRSLGHFLEKMVSKVMEKQEKMHTELIETIEKIEKDRVRREEAWRQMEIERLKKDEALRAQETSRNLALVSFLRNLMGAEINQTTTTTDWPLIQHQKETETKIDYQTNTKYDSGNKRWPESEVQALITLRATLDQKFCGSGSKGSIWEEISVGMSSLGYARTAKKCKEKWENINKYFKRLTENGKTRSSDKTCPYFHELDLLYKSGVMSSGPGVAVTTSSGDEAKSGRDSESTEIG